MQLEMPSSKQKPGLAFENVEDPSWTTSGGEKVENISYTQNEWRATIAHDLPGGQASGLTVPVVAPRHTNVKTQIEWLKRQDPTQAKRNLHLVKDPITQQPSLVVGEMGMKGGGSAQWTSYSGGTPGYFVAAGGSYASLGFYFHDAYLSYARREYGSWKIYGSMGSTDVEIDIRGKQSGITLSGAELELLLRYHKDSCRYLNTFSRGTIIGFNKMEGMLIVDYTPIRERKREQERQRERERERERQREWEREQARARELARQRAEAQKKEEERKKKEMARSQALMAEMEALEQASEQSKIEQENQTIEFDGLMSAKDELQRLG